MLSIDLGLDAMLSGLIVTFSACSLFQVSWLRAETLQILSVGYLVFTHDNRSVLWTKLKNIEWVYINWSASLLVLPMVIVWLNYNEHNHRKCTVLICSDSRSRGAGTSWSLGWRPGTRVSTSVRWWTGWTGPWPGSPGSSSWPPGTSSSASRRVSYRETTPRQSGVRSEDWGTRKQGIKLKCFRKSPGLES